MTQPFQSSFPNCIIDVVILVCHAISTIFKISGTELPLGSVPDSSTRYAFLDLCHLNSGHLFSLICLCFPNYCSFLWLGRWLSEKPTNSRLLWHARTLVNCDISFSPDCSVGSQGVKWMQRAGIFSLASLLSEINYLSPYRYSRTVV